MASALGMDVRQVFTVVFGSVSGGRRGRNAADVGSDVGCERPARGRDAAAGVHRRHRRRPRNVPWHRRRRTGRRLADAVTTWWFQNVIAFTGLPALCCFSSSW